MGTCGFSPPPLPILLVRGWYSGCLWACTVSGSSTRVTAGPSPPILTLLSPLARADRVGRARQDDQAVEHAGRVQVHDRRARRAHRVGLLRALLARRQQPAHRLRRLGPPGQGARPRRPRPPCQGAPGPSVPGRPHVARSARVRCAALPRARSGRGQHPGADWGCHAEPLSAPMRICASISLNNL